MFPALAEVLHLTKAVNTSCAPGAVVPEVCARREGLIVETEGELADTTTHSFTQRLGRRRALLGVGLGDLDVAAGHGEDHRPPLGLRAVQQPVRGVQQPQQGVQAGGVEGTRGLGLVDAGQDEGEAPHGAEHVIRGQPGVVGQHSGQLLEQGEGLGLGRVVGGGDIEVYNSARASRFFRTRKIR